MGERGDACTARWALVRPAGGAPRDFAGAPRIGWASELGIRRDHEGDRAASRDGTGDRPEALPG